MNVAELLIEQARRRPDAVAIEEERRATTFLQLERESARVAGMLRAHGLRPGDGVALFVPMSAEMYAALIGIFRAGCVATLVDPAAADVDACLAARPPRALIATPKAHLLRLTSRAIRAIPIKFSLRAPLPGAITWRPGASAAIEGAHDARPEDGALLTFTSGSTGAPKAAMRSHAFLLAQHEVVSEHLHAAPGERVLISLPVFVLSILAAGATSVLPAGDARRPARVDATRILRQLGSAPASTLAASPAFLERLLDAGGSFPQARRILTGGAPVFPRLLRRLQSAAPTAEVVALYGSTEAEPIAALRWSDVAKADLDTMARGGGLLAGTVVPQARVVIEDDEVLVTGPHVLRGYLDGRGDAETKVRRDGDVWHRTGDAARFDDAGRLWLLGRRAARIEDERGVAWPFAVETALSDRVRRCALVSHRGERILVVEGDADVDPSEAQADRIVRATVPVDRRHNGKVDYPALRRLLDELR